LQAFDYAEEASQGQTPELIMKEILSVKSFIVQAPVEVKNMAKKKLTKKLLKKSLLK
jgi:hypothetical protein